MTERRATPPYSEEQATAWLAWLAYNMRRRDQTIFQIENLQPDWLTGRKETLSFLVPTQAFWGITSGLIFGLGYGVIGMAIRALVIWLIYDQIGSLSYDLVLGLTATLIIGLLGGLLFTLGEHIFPLCRLDIWLNSANNSKRVLLMGTVAYGLMAGLIFGLMAGLIFGLTGILIAGHIETLAGAQDSMLLDPLSGGLAGGLIFGVSYGYIRASRVTSRYSGKRIQPIETLRWSWQNARRSAWKGWIFGLIFGLVFGLVAGLNGGLIGGLIFRLSGGLSFRLDEFLLDVLNGKQRIEFLLEVMNYRQLSVLIYGLIGGAKFGPIYGLSGGLTYGLIFGLSGGLILGLGGGLIGGFQPGSQEIRTRPNQGIQLTLISAVKIGFLPGCAVGLATGVPTQDFGSGLILGTVAFLIVGLWYGGLDVIEHSIIRIIIARRGHAPLNYARFLDYATDELNFLQKVGGGYVFIHRYLLEHFAEIAVERGYVSPADDAKPKRV